MAGSVRVTFDLSDFRARLKAAGARVNRTLVQAARAMAPPVIAETQAQLRALSAKPGWEHTGLTAASIAVVQTKSKGGRASVKVGSRSVNYVRTARGNLRRISAKRLAGNAAAFNPQKVLHLLELGTRPHQIGSRAHPGARAFHMLANAVARKKAASLEGARKVLNAAIMAG